MNTYCGVSVWQWQSNSDYLAHHGIRGQKWGKRNGPPYPLNAGDHSAEEKKAGWRKSLTDGNGKDVSRKAARTLNKLDKRQVRIVRANKNAWEDVNKESYKAKKAIGKYGTESKRAQKHLRKLQERANVAKITEEQLKASEAQTWKLIADLTQAGYSVSGKKIVRDAARGEAMVATLLAGPFAQLAIRNRVVEGNKFSVKKTGDGQLSFTEKRKLDNADKKTIERNRKEANDNYNKVMLLTAQYVPSDEIARRTGLNLDQINDYRRGGFGELTPKVKSWVDYRKEANNLTRNFAIPMTERVEELERKNKPVDRYADDHGVNTRNIPKYIQLTGDPELKRLYEAYKDERDRINKKYPGKMDKWT